MKSIQYYSIEDMLKTDAINYNQSKLAIFLGVHRCTILKFADDVDCDNHMIVIKNGKYRFVTFRGK